METSMGQQQDQNEPIDVINVTKSTARHLIFVRIYADMKTIDRMSVILKDAEKDSLGPMN